MRGNGTGTTPGRTPLPADRAVAADDAAAGLGITATPTVVTRLLVAST